MMDFGDSVDESRVLVTCVAEDRERDRREVYLLFRSLQRFGGRMAHSSQVACFVEHVDARFCQQLTAIGVQTRVVNRLDERCAHANKIRMLMDIDADVDWVVALDTDIAVAGDFSPHLTGPTVRAKPVDYDPLSLEQWLSLFDHFGLEMPPERYVTTFNGSETIAYFNSGVLLVPAGLAARLAGAWVVLVERVLNAYADLPAIARHAFFTDQFALALALRQQRITVDPLPLCMNFPTHGPVHPSSQPDNVEPLLLHHHHLTEGGVLLRCGYAAPDRAIAAVNTVA
jgi:hypothetical protein